jgi:hypothetical protein
MGYSDILERLKKFNFAELKKEIDNFTIILGRGIYWI